MHVCFPSDFSDCTMFSDSQALVYYTFGALGGNLVAHMILVGLLVDDIALLIDALFLQYELITLLCLFF